MEKVVSFTEFNGGVLTGVETIRFVNSLKE